MPSLILNLKKIKGVNPLETCLKHNLRKISAELGGYSGIDATRTNLNKILVGGNNIPSLNLQFEKILSTYKRKIRPDAVRLMEAVFSPSIDFEGDFDELFRDSVEWIGRYLRVPIISAVIHNDEKFPHLHILMVPYQDGRLSAKTVYGPRGQLHQTINAFFKDVGCKYGLYNPRADRNLSYKQRAEGASYIADVLTRFPELITERRIELERAFKINPLLFMDALGIHPLESGREEL